MQAITKQYLRICSLHTVAARTEIRRIRCDLSRIDSAIRQNLSDEKKIAGGLCEVRRAHKTLNDRIEEAGRALSRTKSYLASFQS